MPPIRLLDISGTPYEMGYQHGLAYAADIRASVEERLKLCVDPVWAGQALSLDEVLALGEVCLDYHRQYAPDLVEEVQGTADAVGIGLNELVIMNGFTDFVDVLACHNHPLPEAVDNCTSFVVPNGQAADGRGFVGQTWDMHRSATPFVILLRGKPANAPAFVVFTMTGCVGMIGMNDAGISIGINNILANDGRPGVTWPFVIRKALAQTNLDDALACITSARLAGAHNYVLADGQGRGYNVEAMPSHCEVTPVNSESYVHTNHCVYPATGALERPRAPESQARSESRLNRGYELLAEGGVTVESLMALTRDRGAINGICTFADAPWFVETSGAVIMRPASREMWAVWGLPTENEYERFAL